MADTNPDYPDAVSFTAARWFTPGSASRKVDKVVIHITDGGANYLNTVDYFHTGTERKVSAHYVIGRNGEVAQCVRNADIAWHANTANNTSIGIEHCARTKGELSADDAGMQVTDAQYTASAKLVTWLCGQFNLPTDRTHILGHHEADPVTTHTNCPDGRKGDSIAWDWNLFLAALAKVAPAATTTTTTDGGTATDGASVDPNATPSDATGG